MRNSFKYIISSICVIGLLIPFIYFSYPFKKDECSGIQIKFSPGEIIHSPHSLPSFRKMWGELSKDKKNDSIIRIAIVSSDPDNFSLRDSIADVLRDLFHDPRRECSWQWSKNWSSLKTNFDSPFNHPSTFVNINPGSPHHDYINGWIQFKKQFAERKSLLRIIYKNNFPEIISTFSADSENVLQQGLAEDGNWHMLTWPITTDSAMITIDGRESPQIGNISIEPIKGFSIWTFRIPEKISSASLLHYRKQIEIVSPRFLILTAGENNSGFSNSLSICKKIFQSTPLLVFSENANQQLEETSTHEGCAYLYGNNFSQTHFWKLALQNDIKGCFR
jgi:hypothetical protein